MKTTRRYFLFSILASTGLVFSPVLDTNAQIPIVAIIRAAVKKVINAFDLLVQRIQTKTIWLQNAQRVIENTLSKLRLDEIAQWTQKQRDLYKKYYDDLWKIRKALSDMNRIRQITSRQIQLVNEYKRTWAMVSNDKHFTKSEIDYMFRVYSGILSESLNHIQQLTLIVTSYQTQMSDAKRLAMINHAADGIDRNYYDLQRFNNQNMGLSLNRSKDQNDIDAVRKLYGIH